MALVTIPNRPIGSDARSIAQMLANFDAVTDQVNGNVDGNNLSLGTRQALGVSDTTAVRRGSSVITASEAPTTSWAVLATPDRVSNIVLPSAGLIKVSYVAFANKTVGTGSNLFAMLVKLNTSQPYGQAGGGMSTLFGRLAISSGLAASRHLIIATSGAAEDGILVTDVGGVGTPTDAQTNGRLVGGFVSIAVNAGTYTVEAQWQRDTATTVSIFARRLYVEAVAF